MPRPKGSKNKPKKAAHAASQLEEKLAAQKALKQTLEAEQADILAAIEKQKQLLKAKKKELRAAEKAVAAIEAEQEKAAIIEAAAAQKEEIAQVVTKLVSSGKSPEEILKLLNQ